MTTAISVGIIGFSTYEEKKIEKIFEFSASNERVYKLANIVEVEPVDLLLVNREDQQAERQKLAYLTRYKSWHIPVVTTGKNRPDSEDIYYIRGVLLPSRVLTILDSVQIPASFTDESNLVEQEHFMEQEPSPQPTIVEHAEEAPQATFSTEVENALHVLVVDDSHMMQKTVQLELKRASVPLAVDFADSGEIALEKVRLKKYDFIFLDVMMPGIDGFETCSQIRRLDGMAKTPIIMLTAKTSPTDEIKGLMAGCTTYLTKPFAHEEFQKMLERIMHWVKEFNERK